jgi:hypothetical protein
MSLFGHSGHINFGKHKGTHASRLPKEWAAWALANITNFKTEYSKALKVEEPKPSNRPKRRYILKPWMNSSTPESSRKDTR